MTPPFHEAVGPVLDQIEPGELQTPPDYEGSLFSGTAEKYDTKIDFTIREIPDSESEFVYVVVPGYMGIKPMYADFRDNLAWALNATVATYKHPRNKEGLKYLAVDSFLHPDKLGKQAVLAMIDTMSDMYPDKKIVLIGHSMGGPNAIDAAERRMNRVEGVVLMGSGGLEDGQNLLRLAGRSLDILTTEGKSIARMPKKRMAKMAISAAYHGLRNPLQTLGEGIDIASRDLMTSSVNMLRAEGIFVHAIQFENDKFFPLDIAIRDAGDIVDSMTVIEGLDHVGPQAKYMYVCQHIAWLMFDIKRVEEIKEAA